MLRGLFLFAIAGCGGEAVLDHSLDALDAPAWLGEATYALTRATCDGRPCDQDVHALEGGFLFGSWAYERAAITRGYFEVWAPGITDWDNPELWRELDARVYYRNDPNAAFSWRWVGFLERAGNNARYSFSLRDLDPFFDPARNGRGGIQRPSDCPTFPLREGLDERSYEADVELYFSVNGAELRPAPGQTFRGIYAISVDTPNLCSPNVARVVDQTGGDVAVLQAWFGASVSGLDPSACVGTDCTDAVRAIEGGAPFVNRFVYPGASGLCELVELRTVTPDSALGAATFAGVGFWWGGSFSFVPASELAPVGRVTLRDGAPATVHRFLAQGMCFGQGGNTSAILERRFEFKPFARFDVADALAQYRVWEDVSENHLLGRTHTSDYRFVSSFDRSGALLSP